MEDTSKDVKAEEVPAEPMPTEEDFEVKETAITPFEGDYMEVTVEVAENLEKYEKAINSIMNFVVRRTYAGDWVSHDKESTPLEERTVNMVGAAAERIARDLGMQESNRTKPAKKMHGDKHPGHYYYECEGDFTFRGRTVHAIGMASTLNPFYSKAYGESIDPSKIREEYIMRECWRDCIKQGIKMWFGLRKMPIMKLKELGYDISKVKFVNFKSSDKSQTAKNPEATAKPKETDVPVTDGEQYNITIENMEAKVSSGGKPFYKVREVEGASFFAWGNAQSDLIQKLTVAWKSKQPISVMIKGDKYPTIISIVQ